MSPLQNLALLSKSYHWESGESAFEMGKVPLRLHYIYNHISGFIKGRINHREVWSNLLMFHPLQFYKLWEIACLRSVGFVQTHPNELWSSTQLPRTSLFCVINQHSSDSTSCLLNWAALSSVGWHGSQCVPLQGHGSGHFMYTSKSVAKEILFRFWLSLNVVATTCLSCCIFRAPSTVLNVPSSRDILFQTADTNNTTFIL